MKKKVVRHAHHRQHRVTTRRAYGSSENYLVMVRGWMLVVAFALMLGIGAVIGTFINGQINQSSPTVAGAEISR